MQKQGLDFDALEKELDAEFNTEETASVEEVTEEAPETQEQEPEVYDPEEIVEDEDDGDYEETEEPAVNDPDEHKRNEAFKQLREERDKLAESDKFLTKITSAWLIMSRVRRNAPLPRQITVT